MATKTLTQHICDRCEKTFAETDPAAADNKKNGEAPRPMLILEVTPQGGKPGAFENVKFNDLCPKCHGRVLDLVKQIRLEGKDDDKEKSGTENKTENKEKPDPRDASKPAEGGPKHDKVDTSPKPADNKAKDAKAGEAKAP